MDDSRFRTFFSKLSVALRNEFINKGYANLEILNNFEIKNDYNVTVALTLKCMVRINIVCDFHFPSKAPPKIYLTELYDSPVVNKLTLEVDFSSFFIWTGANCMVSTLTEKLDEYFQRNPPKKNYQLAEVNLLFRDVQNTVNSKIVAMDFNQISGRLSDEDRLNVMDPVKLGEALKGSSEYQTCKMKMSTLVRKSESIAGKLTRRDPVQNRRNRTEKNRIDAEVARTQGNQQTDHGSERSVAAVDESQLIRKRPLKSSSTNCKR